MKKVHYIPHLEFRLAFRKIPHHLPQAIFETPDDRYWDAVTRHLVAVKRVFHKGKERVMMVAYQETDEGVEIITIHPIGARQIANRLKSGRWQRK